MKLQFGAGSLRLRLETAEFAALHGGEVLAVRLDWPSGPWRLDLRTGAALGLSPAGDCVGLTIPGTDVEALAARLPSRDGLRYALELPGGALDVRIEVDLHDGRRPR